MDRFLRVGEDAAVERWLLTLNRPISQFILRFCEILNRCKENGSLLTAPSQKSICEDLVALAMRSLLLTRHTSAPSIYRHFVALGSDDVGGCGGARRLPVRQSFINRMTVIRNQFGTNERTNERTELPPSSRRTQNVCLVFSSPSWIVDRSMGKGDNVMENQVMSYNPYILLYLETACSLQKALLSMLPGLVYELNFGHFDEHN